MVDFKTEEKKLEAECAAEERNLAVAALQDILRVTHLSTESTLEDAFGHALSNIQVRAAEALTALGLPTDVDTDGSSWP